MSQRTDQILANMTLEQKVGQMFCLGFCGTYPYPDIVRMITDYHVAGFRVTPGARKFVRYFGPEHPGTPRVTRDPEPDERMYSTRGGAKRQTAGEYAQVLNSLRKTSMESGAGVPVYFSLDYEGNVSGDCPQPGMIGIPHPMGLVTSGDPQLCYRVGKAVAEQLKIMGIDWVHSPDIDVQTTPSNPEIGTRAFSNDPTVTAKYALAYLEGYKQGNLIATGKHFPGRGHSSDDAHFGVPVINESKQRMHDIHLAPYRALIANGLPAIMLAHSEYPALDGSGTISTISQPIITDLLREEMGFDGVIMTDSFTMGGLVARYEVAEAAIRSFEAGVDLLLLKDENALRGEVIEAVIQAVKSGRIPESQVDTSVQRVLTIKEEYGILDYKVDPFSVQEVTHQVFDSKFQSISTEAAERSLVTLRDDASLIPLPEGKRVLVIEGLTHRMLELNDDRCYLGQLYEALLENGVDAIFTDFEYSALDDAWPTIRQRADVADLIVLAGFYQRGKHITNTVFDRFTTLGKPMVFVTNSPYPEVVSDNMPTVLVTFNTHADGMRAAAKALTGKLSTNQLGFDPTRTY